MAPNSDVYAQNLDGSGMLLWGTSGVPVCQASGSQYGLSITTDGRDPTSLPGSGAIVAWFDYRSSFGAIYAQSLVGNGSPRWAVNGVVVCSAPTWGVGKPVITTDGTGAFPTTPKGAIIAWEDTRNGTFNRDIYAHRLNGTGVPQWTANGTAVCNAPYDQFYPKIAFVGSGNAIVAWADNRTGISYDTDIYAQRVGVDGGWATTDGVPVCSPPGYKDSEYFKVISDSKGGGVFAWAGDGASATDIFAQRIGAPGSPLWTLNGVALSYAPGSQIDPSAFTDGASGALVAWDSDPDYNSIYVQHVDSSGVSRWYPGGLPICIAPGERSAPAITADYSGGAIVAWLDSRDGRVDIYAQHVTPDGGVVGVEPIRRPGFQLVAVSPNPTRGAVSFRLELPAASKVTARILGVDGRLIRTLVDGVELAQSSPLRWDLGDSAHQRVPSGVYFLQVIAGAESRVHKIVSLR